ncbi:MAG: c-type cytochrome [Terriglobia bacterium]
MSIKTRSAAALGVFILLGALSAQTPAGPARASGRGGRGGGGGRGFPQQSRPLAEPDVLARGKAVFESNCARCHATDLRGNPPEGHSLLHSMIALNDKRGELIGDSLLKHEAPITLAGGDPVAVAEYVHSILATVGGQGSPPGRPDGSDLNILVGDAKAGQAYFAKACAGCHSATGDLKGIAGKYADARALQNGWLQGTSGPVRFSGRGGGAVGFPAIVTMPDGQKLEGKIVRKDDFLVVLTLADGTRKSIARHGDVPKLEVKDPNEAHKKMALAIDDPANKNLHDITAYLATLK